MSEAPATPQPAARPDLYVILPHPRAPRILLLPDDDGWTLPRVELDEPRAIKIRPTMRQQFGVDATQLRIASYHEDPEHDQPRMMILVLENHSPAWQPPAGSRWLAQADLAELPLADPVQRATIATYFHEEEPGQTPAQRAPWARRGWFAPATAWMAAQLTQQGITVRGEVEQVRTWGISCLLRVHASSGDIYFKAVPPLFAAEPTITHLLAAWYPEHVPQVLAIDADRAWMLLRDFGGQTLEESDLPAWEAVMRVWSRIQRSTAGQLDPLLAAGCRDRRLPVLAAQVDEVLADPDELGELTAEEIAQFRAQGPRLKMLCAQLAAYNIPPTLAHGDFHAGNIIVNDGAVIIYDWTDACIAHPFLDMATIVEWMREKTPAARAAVWQTYLAAWAGLEPPERLREAAQIGEVLGCLHQILSYRVITASLEPAAKHEMAGGVSQWVQRMLKLMVAYGFVEPI